MANLPFALTQSIPLVCLHYQSRDLRPEVTKRRSLKHAIDSLALAATSASTSPMCERTPAVQPSLDFEPLDLTSTASAGLAAALSDDDSGGESSDDELPQQEVLEQITWSRLLVGLDDLDLTSDDDPAATVAEYMTRIDRRLEKTAELRSDSSPTITFEESVDIFAEIASSDDDEHEQPAKRLDLSLIQCQIHHFLRFGAVLDDHQARLLYETWLHTVPDDDDELTPTKLRSHFSQGASIPEPSLTSSSSPSLAAESICRATNLTQAEFFAATSNK